MELKIVGAKNGFSLVRKSATDELSFYHDGEFKVLVNDKQVWPIEEKKPEPPKLEWKPIVLENGGNCYRVFLPANGSLWHYSEIDNGRIMTREVSEGFVIEKVRSYTHFGWKPTS